MVGFVDAKALERRLVLINQVHSQVLHVAMTYRKAFSAYTEASGSVSCCLRLS